jgi:Holliday junction DNA helicase RuvB
LEDKIAELVRVRNWDDYVGQQRLKAHFDIKIRAARTQERMLDHTLLIAPPGAGKSTLVGLIADRLGDDMLSLAMPVPYDQFLYEIEGFLGGVVFLDEIHNAPRAFLERLQFGLHDDDRYLPGAYGERVSTNHVTFIAATTTADRQRLMPPLVQRFKYRPSWEPYSDEEMGQIVAGMAGRASTEISPEVCVALGRAAGGVPRAAQGLVAAARDLAAVDMEVTVDTVLELAGLDRDGLTGDHLLYLQTLDAVGGTAGLSVIVSMMGSTTQQVQDLERMLVLRGFVRRTGNGRRIMAPGRAKIRQADEVPAGTISRRRRPA